MKEGITTIRECSRATGIPQRAIREMVRQGAVDSTAICYGGKPVTTLVSKGEVLAAAAKSGITGRKVTVYVGIPENIHARIPKPRARWILDLVRRNVPAGTNNTKPQKGQNE